MRHKLALRVSSDTRSDIPRAGVTFGMAEPRIECGTEIIRATAAQPPSEKVERLIVGGHVGLISLSGDELLKRSKLKDGAIHMVLVLFELLALYSSRPSSHEASS